MALKAARIMQWEDQEQFRIKTVAVLMMKAGWMISVRKTEAGMIDNSTVYRCGIRGDCQN